MCTMGSFGKDDHRNTSIHEDFDYVDTQPFDSHSSPSSPSCLKHDVCGDDECRYLENTVPFDDDDAFEETEQMNLAGETQVLEIAGETQPLDGFDGGEDTYHDTQLLDGVDEGVGVESDGQGSESDRTEVLENVDEVACVDDPQFGDSAQSAECKGVVGESSCGHGDKKLSGHTDHGVIDQKTSSGSMPPRFTFLRAESLRKAALATHNMALKQNQGETNSVIGQSQSCKEPLAVKDNGESLPRCSEKVREVDQEYDHGKYGVEIEGFKNKNMCKGANSAVRKLFSDDLPVETNVPSLSRSDFDEGEGLDKLHIYHGELEGLSYVNSQEPGELSQVNALDFVDRFVKDNIMDFDQETNQVKNVEEKSKSLPSTEGRQSLAKTVNVRGKAGKTGIYDWDDSREDEGGGDLFQRRREDFFEGGTHRPKSMPGFQKIKIGRPKDDKNDEEQLGIPNKRRNAVQSDSRLVMHNRKVRDNTIQEATRKLKRNLANELDEQFNTSCSRGEMEPNSNADAQEMLDVGFDTQMAAEAMEALCNAEDIVDHVANDATHVNRNSLTNQLNKSSSRKVGPVTSKGRSGQYNRKRKADVTSDLRTSGLSKKCTKEVRQCKKDNMMTRSKRKKLNAEDNGTSSPNENVRIVSSPIIVQRKSAGALKRHQLDELNNCDSNDRGSGGSSTVNKKQLQGEVCHFTPIARRTRQSLAVNQLIRPDIPSKRSREGNIGFVSLEKSGTGLQASKALDPKSTQSSSDHSDVDDNTKLCQLEKLAPNASAVSVSNNSGMDALDCPRRRRSLRIRKLSNQDKGSESLVGSSKPSAQSKDIGKSTAGKRKMRTESRTVVKLDVTFRTQSSSYGSSVISSIDQKQGKISEPNLDKANPGDTPICCNVMDENSDEQNNADVLLSTNNVTSSDESPRERCKSSDLASATPANCKMPVNDASPVCMGDDYYKQSCNSNLSRSCLLKVFRKELQRELHSLSATRPELTTPSKDSRKRRDMTDVRILYSHHLDEDIIKHQKKILARLGVSVASSIADATHFIADEFVRTRNMLEAIASGKPVVTHLWIESCGQASCLIDERNYILRDAKKEKEFGFSMPVSLARASQHPLLEGRRVLITSNTKPSKEIISSLVKAVQGQAVERIGRSALKDHKIPDDLLILSCEEDYASCVPFLEKGAAVYSSELLLNGIVTQKLEFERHQLFADHVKKTRSTIWLKRDGRTFLPVTKCN